MYMVDLAFNSSVALLANNLQIKQTSLPSQTSTPESDITGTLRWRHPQNRKCITFAFHCRQKRAESWL